MSILVTDTYEHKHMTPVNEAVSALRSHGYLVLPPGDTSPLGELVRAVEELIDPMADLTALAYDEEERLFDCLAKVQEDPTIRAWVDRGRG